MAPRHMAHGSQELTGSWAGAAVLRLYRERRGLIYNR
jgi:hypothetical protein